MTVFTVGLQAQRQYYFRVGDTIRGRDSIYFYQWWSEDWLSDSTTFLNYLTEFNNSFGDNVPYSVNWNPNGYNSRNKIGRYVRYNYTDVPLKIVGLAACVDVLWGDMDFHVNVTPRCMGTDTIEPTHPEYLLLYDAIRDSFPLVASVEFHNVEPVRYMDLHLRTGSEIPFHVMRYYTDHYCCRGNPMDTNLIVPVHEYYFDKPVTVYDSFYVGMTGNFTISEYAPPEYNPGAGYTASAYTIGYISRVERPFCPDTYTDTCYSTPLHLYKYKAFMWHNGQIISDTNWLWYEGPFFSLIFPIIEIDSSYYDGPPQYVCPEVENFRVGNEGDGNVVLLWNNHNEHLRWEVRYGLQGIEPEDGNLLIASIPAIQITNLDTCTHYTAYIRAVCMHDSLHYSEWSEPLDICLCDTGGAAAIEVPMVEQLTYLMPNPAANKVQVMSSYGMTRVEAYSLQGAKMVDVSVRGLGTTLDVNDWPEGMYIVVVHTPAGNVTKKLVVGR